MPVQLDKIECSFCKEFYRPKTRAQKKYCSKKCQYDGGNQTKRNRREGLRKNIAILKSLKIPQDQAIQRTKEQLNALSFNGDIFSKKENFWNEALKVNSTKYYYDYYTISNQGGIYIITELK